MRTFTAVKFVNEEARRFNEISEEIAGLLRGLEDVLGEALQALLDAVEAGLEEWDPKTIVQAIEHSGDEAYRRARAALEGLPTKLRRRLSVLLRPVPRSLEAGFDALAKSSYAVYLSTGREETYYFSILMYAGKLALSPRASHHAPLFVVASAAMIARNLERATDALAIAAYGLKEVLPVPAHPEEPPWEAPRKWAALLKLSHTYQVGAKVRGELLAAWGLLEAMESA